jgi:hypothetical protein
LGTISHLGLAVLEHERQLALAEDVHQRVHHRADARAGQIGQRELPPVGQLAGDDVVAPHAQARQADGDAVGHRGHLAVGERVVVAASTCTAVSASLSGQAATQASRSSLMVRLCQKPWATHAARRGGSRTASNSMACLL